MTKMDEEDVGNIHLFMLSVLSLCERLSGLATSKTTRLVSKKLQTLAIDSRRMNSAGTATVAYQWNRVAGSH